MLFLFSLLFNCIFLVLIVFFFAQWAPTSIQTTGSRGSKRIGLWNWFQNQHEETLLLVILCVFNLFCILFLYLNFFPHNVLSE